jgi:hypothetical protein
MIDDFFAVFVSSDVVSPRGYSVSQFLSSGNKVDPREGVSNSVCRGGKALHVILADRFVKSRDLMLYVRARGCFGHRFKIEVQPPSGK